MKARNISIAIAIVAALLAGGEVLAYQRYNSGCQTCHGAFTDSTSTKGSVFPSNNKHEMHRSSSYMDTDCNLCHTSGDNRNPFIGSSNGAAPLPGLGCTGCHVAAGLRRHHQANDVTTCYSGGTGCHGTSDPDPPGENVQPPYYGAGAPYTLVDNTCNPTAANFVNENWTNDPGTGPWKGLDTDGDNLYDMDDPDCGAAVCGNGTVETGEQCDDGNTANGDCCSSTCQFEGTGSTCDDGQFCTLGDGCNGAGACVGGGPRDCSDGIACTTDSCDDTADTCVHTPSDAACSDGQFCNGVETCNVTTGCQPGSDVLCDDDDICTDDGCNETTDQCDFIFDPTNDPSCAALVCGNGTLDLGEQCDDGNTSDGDCCSSTCQFEGTGSPCEDGQFCTVGDGCNGAGACVGGGPRDCSDGIACTTDSCDDTGDTCTHAPSDAACSDGQFCNGVETCNVTTGCQLGTPVDCDDGDICTDDGCNEATRACDHIFNPDNDPSCLETACGNGRVEPGEQCDDGNTSDGDCCSSTCQFEASGSNCSDGFFCTVGEACDGAGACSGASPRDCSDGVGCTVDDCDEAGAVCVHIPNDATCDDGQFCNGVETCDVVLDCRPGADVNCDDGDICTDDACDDAADRCDHVFNPANDPSCAQRLCGNGMLDVGEQCDDGNTADGDCCSSTCQFEGTISPCEDGLFCTVGDACDGAGVCVSGGPRDCSDGIACTTDSCDDTGDTCVHTPIDAACSDGQFCNGVETCNVATGCQPGSDVLCDDDDICTDDGCNETTDQCDFIFDPTNDPSCAALVCGDGTLDPGEQCDDGNQVGGDCCSSTCQFEGTSSLCEDGLFCTVGDVCDGSGACLGGTDRNCDDAVSCTTDGCDEGGRACTHTPDNAVCDDGQFCNGTETCDPATGCEPGTALVCDDDDICTDDSCNDATDQCDFVFDRNNAPECAAFCPDADADGFSAAGGGCGPIDCDDSDATVYPGATESCSDDRDNDCDGLIDAADGACGGSPSWSVRAGTLLNPDYAGSPACATCHATQYDTWSRTLHARMLTRPGDAQAAGFPLPEGGSVSSWTDVLFIVGQKWKTLYVDRSGELRPLQWNYARGQWTAYPGGPYDCGACHTTGYDAAEPFEDNGQIVPGIEGAWVEYNVGCEACHGPGAEHATAPSKSNINRIVLDWTSTGEGIRTPSIRSAEVCGNCHFRGTRFPAPDGPRRNNSQYNDWAASPHATSLEPTTLSTYCAKCHSPGNATMDSEEHYFTYFDPTDATHVACISCHDPHGVSNDRWATLDWPSGGRQDPKQYPAALARYRGTDAQPSTSDYSPFPSARRNDLCTDCHKMQPGFRRHVDASPPTVVVLHPPFNNGEPFEVPHMEHIEEGRAECVSCHMPYSRTSINPGDVRTHTLLPNEIPIGGNDHFDSTCGQCHDEALDCVWCHGDFGRQAVRGPIDRGTATRPVRRTPSIGVRPRGSDR